jgi:hypothetical protein
MSAPSRDEFKISSESRQTRPLGPSNNYIKVIKGLVSSNVPDEVRKCATRLERL